MDFTEGSLQAGSIPRVGWGFVGKVDQGYSEGGMRPEGEDDVAVQAVDERAFASCLCKATASCVVADGGRVSNLLVWFGLHDVCAAVQFSCNW